MPSSRHLFLPGGALPPRPNDDGRALVAWLQGLGRGRRDIHAEFRTTEPEIPAPRPEPRMRRAERGRALYAAWCVPCHGEAGDGRGPAAALLSPPPRDLARGQFRFRSVPPGDAGEDADLFRVLTLGTGTGAAMPSFAFLDPEERWSLVLYVRDLAPATRGADLRFAAAPPEPRRGAASALPATPAARTVAPTAQTVQAAGERLYAAWGCAACHGAAGEGKAFVDRREPIEGDPVVWASNLTHACSRRAGGSVAAFERALRLGVGTGMPSFAAVLEGEPDAARELLAWLGAGAAVSPAQPEGSDRP
jgi:mono/diheme cytochrome c family protein